MRRGFASLIARCSRQRRRQYSTSSESFFFKIGDVCILRDGRGQRSLIGPLEQGKQRDTHRGVVSHDDIINRPVRSLVKSHSGNYYTVHSPSLTEYTTMSRRKVTPIYNKDAAAIISLLDLYPGARILEAGTGNAALGMYLASSGAIVTSCDVDVGNSTHAEKLVGQFRRGLLIDKMKFHPISISEYLDGRDASKEDLFDGVVLDLPDPQKEFSRLMPHLANDRCIITYVPNLTQVMACVDEASKIPGLHFEKCIDVSWTEWDVRKAKIRARADDTEDTNQAWVCRPKNYEGNSFTAFLAVFRKGLNIRDAVHRDEEIIEEGESH